MLPGAVLLVQQARFLAAIPLVNGNASRVPLQNLTQPLPTKDGGVLRTIGEAVAYMASPPEEETRSQWQLAADAILKQAPVAEVSPPDRSCESVRQGVLNPVWCCPASAGLFFRRRAAPLGSWFRHGTPASIRGPGRAAFGEAQECRLVVLALHNPGQIPRSGLMVRATWRSSRG